MNGDRYKRLLTAILGIPLVLGPMYAGGTWFTILVLVIAGLSQFEVYQLAPRLSRQPQIILGIAAGALLVARQTVDVDPAWLLVILVMIMLDSLRKGPDGRPLTSMGRTVLGIIYPALFLSFLPAIRNGLEGTLGSSDAFGITFLMIALIWICDTAAYYTGSLIGKTPLASSISPKKTVEGAIGGVAGACLGAVAARFLFFPFLSWIDVLAFSMIAGVVGQLGDLVESSLKRSANVKDSGSLLPGHGGFLDRFDSVTLATPVYYLYLVMATTYL